MNKKIRKIVSALMCSAAIMGIGVSVHAEDIEPCTITFTYWGSGAEQAAIEASLKTFQEAYPEITVNAIHIPSDDFLTKINSMIAAG